jgi:Tfp pilus assembly protein PilZ
MTILYKLLNDSTGNPQNAAQRLTDMACFPFDPDNSDYQAYLKFLENGGIPLPAENT